ncbi:MAG: sigma-70 family RNA polymerase sigma factor [Opitutaceae bacterium]|nr:sigma-70 family RNA polymerase sigma factor [Opitutaceae bacterium]
MPPQSDPELLRRYTGLRAEDAFAELVRRHLNLVYFAALRRTGGNDALAEEITQDVFTALARQASSLSHHAALTGWLYTTTRFTAANAMRAERRRKAREQEAHIMSELDRETRPSTGDWERLRLVIDEALDALNEREREAVLMRCLQDRPFADIGRALGLSEDAARMRFDRALEKLRGVLARRGVTSTVAALGVALANQAAATAPSGLAASITGAALAGAGGATMSAMTFFHMISTTKFAAGCIARSTGMPSMPAPAKSSPPNNSTSSSARNHWATALRASRVGWEA